MLRSLIYYQPTPGRQSFPLSYTYNNIVELGHHQFFNGNFDVHLSRQISPSVSSQNIPNQKFLFHLVFSIPHSFDWIWLLTCLITLPFSVTTQSNTYPWFTSVFKSWRISCNYNILIWLYFRSPQIHVPLYVLSSEVNFQGQWANCMLDSWVFEYKSKNTLFVKTRLEYC